MSNDILDEVVRIGSEAEYITSTEAYRRIMDELDKGLVDQWAAGTFKTQDEREDAFNRVRGARMFRDRFTTLIENMKMQKAKIDRAQKADRARGQI